MRNIMNCTVTGMQKAAVHSSHQHFYISDLKMVHMSWQHAVKPLAPDNKYCCVVCIIKILGHGKVRH